MTPPTVLQALRLSARAVGGSLWLASLALALAAAFASLWLPVQLFPGAVVAGALASAPPGGLSGAAEVVGAALLAPRTLFTLAGLSLAALLLHGALRLLWLGGALATLGEELSGRRWPAFASGAVRGFSRLAGTWLLASAAQALAAGTAAAAGVAVLALVGRVQGNGGAALALLGAATVTGALLLAVLAGLFADAALARAAVRGERPLRALAAAARRVGGRPSAFLAVALAVGASGLVLGGSLQTAGQVAIDLLGARLPPVLLALPQIALAALGALLAALFELWRLGAVATLACSVQPGD